MIQNMQWYIISPGYALLQFCEYRLVNKYPHWCKSFYKRDDISSKNMKEENIFNWFYCYCWSYICLYEKLYWVYKNWIAHYYTFCLKYLTQMSLWDYTKRLMLKLFLVCKIPKKWKNYNITISCLNSKEEQISPPFKSQLKKK